jgi:hypothetical protein
MLDSSAVCPLHFNTRRTLLIFFGRNNKEVKDVELNLHKRTHSLTHGAEPLLRSCQLCSYSRTSQHFLEPEGSRYTISKN